MSFNKHGHHHKQEHHHQPRPYVEEEYCSEVYEGERVYGAPPPAAYYEGERVYGAPPPAAYYERERERGRGHGQNNFQQNERLGELGAVAAGAFALYEEHKAKTDLEHASKHKLEEGAGAIGALGSAGYAYYKHRQKDKFEDGCRW